MNAIDVINKLVDTDLINCDLRYCLVSSTKLPHKIDGSLAKPNSIDDFVSIDKLLQCESLSTYAGVGISIQASKICAIDVDHCFKIQNDISSIDERGKAILDMFKDIAYCEFSFSGTGLRILFKANILEDYSLYYYIKNERNQVEYYQPTKSFRYVTITGNVISNNKVNFVDDDTIDLFLDTYMKKPEFQKREVAIVEDKPIEELMNKVKFMYFKNKHFQDLWFAQAPGSNSNESELDYELIACLYENITQNKDKLKTIFESSPYFKSKDWKHKNKWTYQEGRYYNYIYTQIQRRH